MLGQECLIWTETNFIKEGLDWGEWLSLQLHFLKSLIVFIMALFIVPYEIIKQNRRNARRIK